MKILLSGSSGFIGKALQESLATKGHQVVTLVRHHPKNNAELFWNPSEGKIDKEALENFDALIHLGGENIAEGRWTEKRKAEILNSRVESTKTLAQALSQLKMPPKTFICASAIGIYGDRGEAICTEETAAGTGFLAEVCKQWEAATQPANEKGIRVVNLRSGVVLSSEGGALKKMLTPFRLGLGGILGTGKQYMSWIAIDDLLAIVMFILTQEALKGPINIVSPHPVTNAEFTHTLGEVLHKPTFCRAPEFALKLLLGKEKAEEMLLSSIRAEPKVLEQAGYSFRYPELKHFLKEATDG